MAVKTYRKTALVAAEQFLPAIGQIPAGVYSTALGHPSKRPDAEWVLDTKEARHTLRVGDYICTGSKGEKWNVEREIFEETYEEVEASPQEKYLNLVDGKIYDLVSKDEHGVNLRHKGRGPTYFLGIAEFERRFQLHTPAPQTRAVAYPTRVENGIIVDRYGVPVSPHIEGENEGGGR